MKQIRKTLMDMLFKNSMPIIVFFSLSAIIAILKGLLIGHYSSTDSKTLMLLISRFLVFSIILGSVINTSFKEYKQTYLWKTNKVYRNSIKIASLSILLMVNVILLLLWYRYGQYKFLVLILAILITFNGMYIKKVSQLFILGVPFIIFLTNSYDLSILVILLSLIIYCTVILANRFFTDENQEQSNSKFKRRKSYFVNNKLSRWITFSNGNVEWSLCRPSIKFGIPVLLYSTMICTYLWVVNKLSINTIDTRVILFVQFGLNLSNLFMMFFSIQQTQPFAHVYEGVAHSGIKNKIIKSFDKIIILHNLLFILMILSFIYFFKIDLNLIRLGLNLLFIFILILNSYMFIFSMKSGWFFILFIVLFILTILMFHSFLKESLNEFITGINVAFVIVVFVLLRILGKYLLFKTPYEKLVKLVK